MRRPNLQSSVTLGQQTYTVDAMLREFVWGHPFWSTDEATVASFERLQAAKTWNEEDFARVCQVLRQVQFPPHASIECAHLRNKLVLTPMMVEETPKGGKK